MNITLNGKPHALDQDSSVADLVRSLGYEGKRIAVERNGDIVPKSRHAHTSLANDDVVEIVVAVGGG
ncbi:sulfur carrier protein ThiS [Pusillimonas noertemannii]|uniref:Sulfur carrier protein ThiS n=1 Tax=Pusillimonas noertemannii TaxID=305977 RepID=A0A2U1CM51_9BURK|nr:sulfur carrier protein ThiS [Pusillimonas noertemannii]NYT68915.1 sulfur carrier protein ThiS [Pusillimonas noertemannii]PVY62064.1 sulfur carrier protein ThiS [Pusillimonas noertemannii]TFL10937.1 sulfur carrier protein ThiS [Pusillimonas noertemannii]